MLTVLVVNGLFLSDRSTTLLDRFVLDVLCRPKNSGR